jgi:putative PEP-CTERM system TPR-repeat lipoprotein
MTIHGRKSTLITGHRLALSASIVMVVGVIGTAAWANGMQVGNQADRVLTASVTSDADQSKLAKLLDQARQAMAQDQPRVAVIFLKNAVAIAPDDGQARFQLGIALLKSGDATSAERELRNALQHGVADESVLPFLFNAMLVRSEGKQLLAQFPAPAEGDKSALASDTLRARATALAQANDLKEAAASLDRALSFDKSVPTLVARAQLSRSMGDTDLALKLIDEALSKSPKDVLALVTKVGLLSQTRHNDQALSVANDLVKYYPENPEALMTRAGIYLQLQQHDKAMDDINASLKVAPDMALGVYYKALAMEQADDVKQAWDLAQSLPPAFVNSRAAIGSAVSQMATKAGHLEIGTSILASAVQNFPKDPDARIRLAARYIQLKDADRALETLQPMADSSDPRIMVLIGQAYDMQHDYSKSVEYLEKASASGVGGDALKRQIALSNLEAGKLDTAIDELTKLNTAAPDDPQTVGALIDALLRQNEFAKALEVATRLESAAPKSPYGALFQGQLLLRRGDLDGAVSAFSRSISHDKTFVPALYQRSMALAARGDVEGADADLRSILASDPNNMAAQIKLAQIAIRAGQADKATALLKQAVDAHPKEVLPSLILASFGMRQGHLDDAASAIGNFLERDPDNASALAMQGQVQLVAGKLDQAVTTLRQVARALPKSPQVQLLLASALAKSGNTKGATSAYQDAIQLAPSMQAAHIGLIGLALTAKDTTTALSAAQDYADKQPGPASAETLARTYATLNRTDDAINTLAQSQTKYPNGATLILLSSLERHQGQGDKAAAMLADWIDKHPDDTPVRLAYAETRMNADPGTAEAQYRAVLTSQPYNLTALNNLSWLLQSDPQQALPYAERAAKMAPHSANVLDTLGWTKWRLEDKSAALDLLQRAYDREPKNPEITYHLVVALDGNGRRADAKTTLDKLLAGNQEFTDRKKAEALNAKWQ